MKKNEILTLSNFIWNLINVQKVRLINFKFVFLVKISFFFNQICALRSIKNGGKITSPLLNQPLENTLFPNRLEPVRATFLNKGEGKALARRNAIATVSQNQAHKGEDQNNCKTEQTREIVVGKSFKHKWLLVVFRVLVY